MADQSDACSLGGDLGLIGLGQSVLQWAKLETLGSVIDFLIWKFFGLYMDDQPPPTCMGNHVHSGA